MRLAILALGLCVAGCANSDQPPPAKIGSANFYFVPRDLVATICLHPKSPVEACTYTGSKQIVLPLPQDYPDDHYAYLVQFELAHAQQGWPDPPDIQARLARDAAR
jgi:hypothetical protein